MALSLPELMAAQGDGAVGDSADPTFGRAKNVIYLFMLGGPSHVDLFEDKPALRRFHGDAIPQSYVDGVKFEQIREEGQAKLVDSWVKLPVKEETSPKRSRFGRRRS